MRKGGRYNGCQYISNEITRYRPTYLNGLFFFERRFFLAPVTSAFFYSSTIETDKAHKTLPSKNNRVHVQKK